MNLKGNGHKFLPNAKKVIVFCDRGMAFSIYVLIFFVPISIAILESFFSFALSLFFLKRGVLFYLYLKENSVDRILLSFWQKAKKFIMVFKPVESRLNLPIGILIFVNALSVIMSQYPLESIKGFVFKLLEGTFLYFIFLECMKTKRQLQIFISVFLISACLVMASGFVQWFNGNDFIFGHPLISGRINSSMRHPNDFGAYLLFVCLLFLGMSLFYKPTSKYIGRDPSGEKISRNLFVKPKIFWSGLSVVSIISLGLTFSRGAWVGFFIALLYVVFLKRRSIFILLGIFALFIVFFSSAMMFFRKFSFFNMMMGSSGRLDFWKESWDVICDFPIFGVGLNAYSKVVGAYPHNCYLQMAAETGLVGLATFLWVVMRLFVASRQNAIFIKDSFLASGLMGLLAGLLGFLIHSFFDTNMYSVQLAYLMWLMIGVIVAIQKIDYRNPSDGISTEDALILSSLK